MDQGKFKVEIVNRVYRLTVNSLRLLNSISWREVALSVIAKQLIRSITSIGANVAEAQGAVSNKDFINFLSYAFKSSNESLYWWNLLIDTELMQDQGVEKLLMETREIDNILGASIITLKKKQKG